MRSDIWNDGPDFPDFMGSEGAPPIARRHLCSGGGGGGGGSSAPDYSQYIATMTKLGEKGQGWASDLYDWAKKTGVDLTSLAKTVSDKAGAAADTQQKTSDRLMGEWEKTYGPLYQAQAADAERMLGDLPGYEEHVAGKYQADTAQAIDAAKAAQQRNLRAQGFSPSAVASQAIDTTAGLQRAAALTAAGETGRYAARSEARDVTGKAIQQGNDVANVATTQGGQATANRNQQANAPLAAASTSAGLYSPAQGFYTAATPYYKAWGDTMLQAERNNLQREQQNAQNDDGGVFGTLLPLAGGIAGSFAGGAGGGIGSAVGKAAAKSLGFQAGGRIPGRRYAGGGAIDTGAPSDNLVPPEASPSGGADVDDVNAQVSVGEFVIPKRTVDWLGDKFFQKLIEKTDNEINAGTVAAPDQGGAPPDPEQQMAMQPGAIDMSPPMFRSEGART